MMTNQLKGATVLYDEIRWNVTRVITKGTFAGQLHLLSLDGESEAIVPADSVRVTEAKAGTVRTTWELRTYDVWGNSTDGWIVNNSFSDGKVELRIPATRHNVGVEWRVCRNPKCPHNGQGVLHTGCICAGWCDCHKPGWPEGEVCDCRPACEYCYWPAVLESQEFTSAAPTDRQIKRAFGVTCRITTGGDDLHITVERARDGYPIGEMTCTSHESLSPVRKAEVTANV